MLVTFLQVLESRSEFPPSLPLLAGSSRVLSQFYRTVWRPLEQGLP